MEDMEIQFSRNRSEDLGLEVDDNIFFEIILSIVYILKKYISTNYLK